MRVRDTLTGAEVDVRARLTINCAGAGVNAVMGMFGVRRDVLLAKAMNLVTSKPASDIALAAPAFAKARPAAQTRSARRGSDAHPRSLARTRLDWHLAFG